MLLFASFSSAQTKPGFSPKDRELIEAYYLHVVGTLAPGSLDRSPFPLEIEKALIPGSHVPLQLEKELEPLPAKLESQLTQLTGEFGRYTLGTARCSNSKGGSYGCRHHEKCRRQSAG
jgi:hypothetical protein